MLHNKYPSLQRNRVFSLTRLRTISIALAFACIFFAGARIWRSQALQKSGPSPLNQLFYAQVRAGIGSEVRFATSGDSADRVRSAVESADNFIYSRSGLKMSNQTKARLIEMELRTLNGASNRVSTGYLINALAETAIARLSGITDEEIDYAARVLRGDQDFVQFRASGGPSWTSEEFISQARFARDASLRNDASLKNVVNTAIDEQVRDRISFLGEALPEQFGRAPNDGITPLQTLIITYSVMADDTLHRSRSDLQGLVAGLQKGEGKDINKEPSGRAFGVNGKFFSTPLNLFFESRTIQNFLDRVEKGGGK